MASSSENRRKPTILAAILTMMGALLMAMALTACAIQQPGGSQTGSAAGSAAGSASGAAAGPASNSASDPAPNSAGSGSSANASSTASPSEGKAGSDERILACLGDSITYGYGLADPASQAWPALLQSKLGPDWRVVNLGVSGTTLLDEGGFPYRTTGNVARALELDPTMAIIMLGTNDSVDPAWNATAYRAQLEALADELIDASSCDVQIVLMAPPCTFFGPGDARGRGTINELIGGEMRDIVKEVAAEKNARYVDLFAFTQDHPEWFPDDLHPDEAGNRAFADFLFEQIFSAS